MSAPPLAGAQLAESLPALESSAPANGNTLSSQKLEALCSYLPASILSYLTHQASNKLVPPFRQAYTTAVLFADVYGYTAMCEAMSLRGNRIAPIEPSVTQGNSASDGTTASHQQSDNSTLGVASTLHSSASFSLQSTAATGSAESSQQHPVSSSEQRPSHSRARSNSHSLPPFSTHLNNVSSHGVRHSRASLPANATVSSLYPKASSNVNATNHAHVNGHAPPPPTAAHRSISATTRSSPSSPPPVAPLSALSFSLSVSHGPGGDELLAKHLNSYFEQLVHTIADHGGDVFKFAGDAILVLWPPPAEGLSAAEEEADLKARVRCAAQCGMDIKTRLQDIAMGDGITLTMKVGVGVGELSILHVGGVFQRMEYIATGVPLLQAFAAEHQAAQRDVVVSPEAFMLIKDDFHATLAASGYAVLHSAKENSIAQLVACAKDIASLQMTQAALRWNELEMSKMLGRYVPGAVLPYIQHGEEKWASELRRITVLFVNLGMLNESTHSSTSSEELSFIQSILHATQLAVYKYEGSLNKFLRDDKGSNLIAVFGLPPLAHEDDAVRGTLTALAICARLIELGLKPSVGVTTGMAFCGIIGTRHRREYSVLGDKVNLAARLMQHASAGVGGVLCDHETRYAAEDRLHFEALGKISVKGKANPVSIYQPYPKALAPLFSFHGKKTKNKASLVFSGPPLFIAPEAAASSQAVVTPAARSQNLSVPGSYSSISSSASTLPSLSSTLSSSVFVSSSALDQQVNNLSKRAAGYFEGRSGIGMSSIRSIFDIFKTRPITNSSALGDSPLASTRDECFVFSVSEPFLHNVPSALLRSIQQLDVSALRQVRSDPKSASLSHPIDIPARKSLHAHAPTQSNHSSNASTPQTSSLETTVRHAETHESSPSSPESDQAQPLMLGSLAVMSSKKNLNLRRHSTPDFSAGMRSLSRPSSSSNLLALDQSMPLSSSLQDKRISARLQKTRFGGPEPMLSTVSIDEEEPPPPLPPLHARCHSISAHSQSLSSTSYDLMVQSAAPLVDIRRTSLSAGATPLLQSEQSSPSMAATSFFTPTFNHAFNTPYASVASSNGLDKRLLVVLPDGVSSLQISTHSLPTVRQMKEEVLLTLYRRSLLTLPAEISLHEMMDEWSLSIDKEGEQAQLPDDATMQQIGAMSKQAAAAAATHELANKIGNAASPTLSSSIPSSSFSSSSSNLSPVTTVYLHHNLRQENIPDQLAHFKDIIQRKILHLVQDMTGGTLILQGDVGLGKSLLLNSSLADLADWLPEQLPELDPEKLFIPHVCRSLANPFDSARPLSVYRDLFLSLCDAEVIRQGVVEFCELSQSANRRRLIAQKLRLKRRLDDVGSNLDSWMGCLNEVITGLDCAETSETLAMSREERVQISILIMATFFTLISRVYPIILVIDEAVFLDHYSWILTLSLSRYCGRGLLLVLATRPMNASNMAAFQLPPLEYSLLLHNQLTTLLTLQPRSEEFIYQVACEKFGPHVKEIPIALAQYIIKKAHGNPLVVQELIYALLHENLVRVDQESGVLTLSPSLPLSSHYPFLVASLSLPIPIPLTLSSILGARLDRLPYLQRMLLKCCAVMGESIDEALLMRVWKMRTQGGSESSELELKRDEQVRRELAGLLQMNIVRKSYGHEERERWELVSSRSNSAAGKQITPSSEPASQRVKYLFTHGFMREMVLSRMLDAQKQELEQKVHVSRLDFVGLKFRQLSAPQEEFNGGLAELSASPAWRASAASSIIMQGAFPILSRRLDQPQSLERPDASWLVLYPEFLCVWNSQADFAGTQACAAPLVLYLDEALLCDSPSTPHAVTLIPIVSIVSPQPACDSHSPHEFTLLFGAQAEYECWAMAIYRQLATETLMPARLYRIILDRSDRESQVPDEEPSRRRHLFVSTPSEDFDHPSSIRQLQTGTPTGTQRASFFSLLTPSSSSPSSTFSTASSLFASSPSSTGRISGGEAWQQSSLLSSMTLSRAEIASLERRLLLLASSPPAKFLAGPKQLLVRKHRRGIFSSSSWKKRFVYIGEQGVVGFYDDVHPKRPSQLLACFVGNATVQQSGYEVDQKMHLITLEVDLWAKGGVVSFMRRSVVLGFQSAEESRVWKEIILRLIQKSAIELPRAPSSSAHVRAFSTNDFLPSVDSGGRAYRPSHVKQ